MKKIDITKLESCKAAILVTGTETNNGQGLESWCQSQGSLEDIAIMIVSVIEMAKKLGIEYIIKEYLGEPKEVKMIETTFPTREPIIES